jgi:chlorobactene glucosyltransferase
VFVLYNFFILLVLLVILFNVLANLLHFDGLRPVHPPEDGPMVSVLIPARNEAHNIEACLRSLLLQDYPHYELIVLDDHSTDATAEIASRLIAQMRNPRATARLIRGEALPEGWVGKNWACHQLSQAAAGEYLLFIDADTIHAQGTISAAVDYATRNRASLVSAWPQMLTGTLGEKLIVPVILLMGAGFCPIWLQRLWQRNPRMIDQRVTRHIAAANGQFMLFHREAYERIGGHEAIRHHVVEDVTLGREVSSRMSEGLRLFNCDALHFSTVRMYRSFGETWEGFTKNMRSVFETPGLFWFAAVMETLCLFAPCLFVFMIHSPAWKLIVTQVAIIYLIRFLLAWRFRTSFLGALLHPIGVFLMFLIGLNSWRRSVGEGVTWKGRLYRPHV